MFTIALKCFANSEQSISSPKTHPTFCLFAIYWASKCYKKPFKFKQKITTKDHVICIKLRDNLHEVTTQFEANSVVFCVKLQRMMNGIAHQERRNGTTASVFPLLFLYLVQPRNVKSKQQSLQESRAFSRLHPRSTQWDQDTGACRKASFFLRISMLFLSSWESTAKPFHINVF